MPIKKYKFYLVRDGVIVNSIFDLINFHEFYCYEVTRKEYENYFSSHALLFDFYVNKINDVRAMFSLRCFDSGDKIYYHGFRKL